MKRVLILATILAVFFTACNKTPKLQPKLINKAEITVDMKAALTAAGLNTEQEIDQIFTNGDLSKDAVFVSKSVIAGFKEGKIYGCDLISIYDIAHSHSYDTLKESSVTVYLKDNSEFSITFPGSKEFDEPFFVTLKTNWREAISTAQKDIEKNKGE